MRERHPERGKKRWYTYRLTDIEVRSNVKPVKVYGKNKKTEIEKKRGREEREIEK